MRGCPTPESSPCTAVPGTSPPNGWCASAGSVAAPSAHVVQINLRNILASRLVGEPVNGTDARAGPIDQSGPPSVVVTCAAGLLARGVGHAGPGLSRLPESLRRCDTGRFVGVLCGRTAACFQWLARRVAPVRRGMPHRSTVAGAAVMMTRRSITFPFNPRKLARGTITHVVWLARFVTSTGFYTGYPEHSVDRDDILQLLGDLVQRGQDRVPVVGASRITAELGEPSRAELATLE